MENRKPILSIFFHNYYGNDQECLDFFLKETDLPFHLFFNGVSGSYYRALQHKTLTPATAAQGKLLHLHYRESTNKGKDIGGKMVLLDAYLRLGIQTDYMLWLHDKNSPYSAHGSTWKKSLFRIAEKENYKKIMAAFQDRKVGMVASQNNIRNEADNEHGRNAYIDAPEMEELKKKYGIRPPGLQFVAGTMFWVRSQLFEEFFSQHPPLSVRAQLEQGNVTDELPTVTHAWERLLCWIITGKGYQIKGI